MCLSECGTYSALCWLGAGMGRMIVIITRDDVIWATIRGLFHRGILLSWLVTPTEATGSCVRILSLIPVLELAQQIRGLKTKSAISLCFTSCRTGNQHGVHSSELACRCSNILDGVDVFTKERHMPLHQMAHILRLRTSVYPASA